MHSEKATFPPETRLGRTALTASDLTEMADFYHDIVGLTVLSRSDTTAVLDIKEITLLVLEHDPDALSRHQLRAGLFYNTFRVPSRAAMDDAVARIGNMAPQWCVRPRHE